MADRQHLRILTKGITEWNQWRKQNRDVVPDLSGSDLTKIQLIGADFSSVAWKSETHLTPSRLIISRGITPCDLRRANLSGVYISNASFESADLTGADLSNSQAIDTVDFRYAALEGANLNHCSYQNAQFEKANLTHANLCDSLIDHADFTEARLTRATLTRARLEGARLIRTNLENADLTGARIYGIAVWDVNTGGAVQKDLIITSYYSHKGIVAPMVSVDDLEVAQFIYLLLENKKIRNVIDTVGKRAVLLLGRFTDGRKPVLELLRKELRVRGYLPIVFDFDPSPNRNLTETASTLAHLSRFVIADITDARSLPQELQRIVPSLPSVPVQPLLSSSGDEYALFRDLLDYPWVLVPYRYRTVQDLAASLDDKILRPVTAMANLIEERRRAIDNTLR